MKKKDKRKGLDYQRVCEALVHPLALRVLRAYGEAEEALSPNDLHLLLDVSLGSVSYHVRRLADLGLLTQVGVAPRRGAIEHYYELAP